VILIECPNCGPRVSGEYSFLGDITEQPPTEPHDIEAWRRYLYFSENSPSWTHERWIHSHGCNAVIELRRHRTSNACPEAGVAPTSRSVSAR
jgi:sarcosine oxidase, subunit delta